MMTSIRSLQLMLSLFLLSFFLLPADLAAQNLILYENTKSEAYLIKYNGGGPSQVYTNQFLQKIGSGMGQTSQLTEFIVVHDEFIRLTQVNPTTYSVQAILKNMRLTGDVSYKQFDLTGVLKPADVRFKLEKLDAGGKVVEGWDFDRIAINSDPAVIANFQVTDTSGQLAQNKVRLGNKQFMYTPASLAAFNERTRLIDAYYAQTPRLEGLYKDIQIIDPNAIDQLDAQESDLGRMQNKIEAIRAERFPQLLGLTAQKDPAGFLPRFQELDKYARDLQANIRDNRARLPELYYLRGQEQLQAGRGQQARADFERAAQLAPTWAAPQVALARMHFREGQPAIAEEILLKAFAEMEADENTQARGRELGGELLQVRLVDINALLGKGKLDAGMERLDLASAFAAGIPGLDSRPILGASYTRAAGAIYQRKVALARTVLESGDLQGAEARAQEAIDYQAEMAGWLSDNSQALAVMDDVRRAKYANLVASAQAQLGLGQLTNAEKTALDAIAYQKSFSAAIPDALDAERMLQGVKQAQYTQLLVDARDLHRRNMYKEALQKHESAEKMVLDFKLQEDSLALEDARSTANALVLKELRYGLQLSEDNRLGMARDIAKSTRNIENRYALGQDPQIAEARKALQAAIFDQECVNAQSEFHGKVEMAMQFSSTGDYLSATETYDEAFGIAKQNGECNIDIQHAQDMKLGIADAARYQSLFNEAEALYSRSSHRKAIRTYLEAGDLFHGGNLGTRFQLKHESLLEFIILSGKLQFMFDGATHFVDNKDYNSALKLAKKLISQRYSKGRLKPLLVRMGNELAVRDHADDPGGDPKSKGARYMNGNKGLKKLYKAYVKQWKRL